MTRSERLAIEGKVGVYIGSVEIATVIPHCNAVKGLDYVATDFDCLYDGREVQADVYEDVNGKLYAVLS